MTGVAAPLAREVPFFFPKGSYSLFGVFHEPAQLQDASPMAFVFCHPFGEEKLWTHRVFVAFARRLAADGYPVLRFDYMGNGDSEGTFSESSLSTALADVQCAIELVRDLTGVPSVGLLGLRLGATIASLVAERVPCVRHLVLWAPIVNGERYMQDVLRINVTTQMAVFREVRKERPELIAAMASGATVNVEGYEMSHSLYSEVAAVRLGAERARFDGSCLIVQIDRQQRPSPELQQLSAAYTAATVEFAEEEPFWKEIPRSYQQSAANLFAVTYKWLKNQTGTR